MATLLLCAAALAGCDKSTSTAAPAPATLTAVPATATAAPSAGTTFTLKGQGSTHPDQTLEYPWKTSFTINIAESMGVGRSITGVSIKVQQTSAGVVVAPTGSESEHYLYTMHASSMRIEPKGSVCVAFDPFWYWLPNGGKEALVTVTFSFLDDNNSPSSEETALRVQ